MNPLPRLGDNFWQPGLEEIQYIDAVSNLKEQLLFYQDIGSAFGDPEILPQLVVSSSIESEDVAYNPFEFLRPFEEEEYDENEEEEKVAGVR